MSELKSTPYAKIHKHNIFEKVYWACRRGFERIVYKFRKSEMLTWAENEVRLACEREREASGTPKGKWDYGCACYGSALKGLKAIAKEGHSGMSIGFTQDILNRLIKYLPLTPIEDIPEVWEKNYEDDREIIYQCKRMSSLFKRVLKNTGEVRFNDVDRVTCEDILSGSRYYSGMIDNIIRQMFPIEMPYMPATKPFVVFCSELLTDRKNGDYDSRCVHHVITPDGKTILINRYFKEGKETAWDEIDAGEWLERVKMDEERAFEDARHSQNNGVTELQNDEISWEHLEEHIIDFVDAAIKLGIDYGKIENDQTSYDMQMANLEPTIKQSIEQRIIDGFKDANNQGITYTNGQICVDYSNAPDMTGEVKHES